MVKKTLTFCFRAFNPIDRKGNCHEQETYSSSKEKKGVIPVCSEKIQDLL